MENEVISLKKDEQNENQQTQNQQTQNQTNGDSHDQTSTQATVSLVFGIISIVGNVFWGWGSLPCVILGIVGIVLSTKAKKSISNGVVRGGFVTSLIGTILSGVAILTSILAVMGVVTLIGLGLFSFL